LRQFSILLETVFNGLWLGVLSYRSLLKIDEAFYNDSDTYRSYEYNRKGLLKWEEEMVERYFRGCKSLLLIGAGGGREVRALQKMGYKVEAFECNPTLQEFGNTFLADEGLTPCIQMLERDVCSKGDSRYDGAIIGWGTYTLIQGFDRRAKFLQTLRSQINDEANILLSFFTRGGDSWQMKNIAFIANMVRFLLRRDRLEVGDSLAPNYVHYFTEPELVKELDYAGFDLIYYSNKSYGHAIGRSKKTDE
jgi:hypothetical protein